MLLRGWLACVICTLLAVNARGQRWDYGPWAGGTGYFGDLNLHTSLRFFGPAAGFYLRYNLDERLSFRLSGGRGHIWGDDAFSPDYIHRVRNLRFFSPITEGTLQAEFNFLPYYNTSNSSHTDPHFFSPYLFSGFSVFHFNPMVHYGGEKVRLQPLGTEGQGYSQYPELKRYKRTTTAFVVGGGFKWRVNRRIGMFAEAGIRKSSTDYLDDVSGVYADPVVLFFEGGPMVAYLADPSEDVVGEPIGKPGMMRGDASKNDDYLLVAIGVSFTIRPYRCPYRQ
ncbi:MAG: DUF6089 family protein [Chitinophagales bacterium]|nr:DUF6089 family protein [Chitinophagales bacterium]MDW8428646.1 DUF6089 family protein [Chitinophagales bacterium]